MYQSNVGGDILKTTIENAEKWKECRDAKAALNKAVSGK